MKLKIIHSISETVYLHLSGIDGGSTVWRHRIESVRAEECSREAETEGEWKREVQDGR